jgi:hypothetical protein
LRLAGFGGGADPGGKSPKKDAFPIAVIAHEKVIRPLRARLRHSLSKIYHPKAVSKIPVLRSGGHIEDSVVAATGKQSAVDALEKAAFDSG